MRLAVSNIAWTNEEEPEVASKLQELGVRHIEIAPTKLWDNPTKVSSDTATEYVDWWAKYGITVSAFQSMLFARPDLKMFESTQNRQELVSYMTKFIELAGVMQAERMVFGSPKNRQRGKLSTDESNEVARAVFGKLGDIAAKNDVILCLEPNAPQYGCDYVTTASEGSDLVRKVASDGFQLHLDTACMALAGDDMSVSIRKNADILQHFHVSAPMLDRVYDREDIDYSAAANALRDINYTGLISIEMRPGEKGSNVERVEQAIKFTKSIFLDS